MSPAINAAADCSTWATRSAMSVIGSGNVPSPRPDIDTRRKRGKDEPSVADPGGRAISGLSQGTPNPGTDQYRGSSVVAKL
jgi:hypothetical protein